MSEEISAKSMSAAASTVHASASTPSPSPLSGWLTACLGAAKVAATGGGLLMVACALAADGADSANALGVAMVFLGVGWNLCLVAGSDLLTADVTSSLRPRREGWGEVSMGIAAGGGGAVSGGVVAAGGYPTLAIAGAVVAAFLLPLLWYGTRGQRRGRPCRQPRTPAQIDQVAYGMFSRNVAEYADPDTIRHAWADPGVRRFWIAQAQAVVDDLQQRS